MPRKLNVTLLFPAFLLSLAAGPLWAQLPSEIQADASGEKLAPRQQAQPIPLDQAVDPDTYRLGPGDELTLSAGGTSDFHAVLLVSPEGTLRVPDLGVRRVAGVSLTEARRSLLGDLRKFFPGAPLDLVLTHPRSYKILVAGAVSQPGLVLMWGPGRAFDALNSAGGAVGDLRRNVILRRGGRDIPLDLLAYQRLGDLSQNPVLHEGDVLLVKPAPGRVGLFGGVNYPAQYELRPGESLGSLVTLSGGFLPSADTTRVRLLRYTTPTQAETLSIGSDFGRPASAEPLQDGDQFYVDVTPHYHEVLNVIVGGQVRHPGYYPVSENRTRLSDVLVMAGGLDPRADSGRVIILRPSEDPPQDTAYVSWLLRGQDLKGFEREYARMRSRVRAQVSLDARRALAAPGTDADPVLRSGDVIAVPQRPTSVLVQGDVVRPGLVASRGSMDLDDFIQGAGGFTRTADRGHLWVTLAATQQMVPAKDVRQLQAGDVLWVPSREPGTFWRTARDVLLAMGQVATIYLVIHDATRSGN